MTTTQNPLVIGIFQDEAKAKQALAELNGAGFAKDQLGFANTDGETANTNLGSELMKFGVPQEHAGYYHNAFQAGQHVVSVRADGREQDAARILSNYGATGLNSDPNAGTAMSSDASQMAAYNTYADPSQNAGNYNNVNTGMANQQSYNDPNYNNASTGMANANQQAYNDPNYNNAGTGMDNANQQQYNNAGYANADQSYNNADQQQYNNNSVNQQQYNDPNYNNQNYSNAGYANADQQQYNNAGYANNDQRYNDPNQGFNQAQNYDPNAFQNNDPNARQERRMDREERRMDRNNNDY